MKTFGNAEFAKKMVEKFGTTGSFTVEIDPVREQELLEFLRKVEQAHKDAANSTLVFGNDSCIKN